MSELDYNKIGLKCGLEIHQQLDTKKLFCNCPSVLRKDEPDFNVRRKLHAVAGESGEIDVAAKYQVSLDKEFVYEGYDTTCLVELDEEPPREINEEALEVALQVSKLLNCDIVDEIEIMRKTVVDGSNVSGFQRTSLIAVDGHMSTSLGKIHIPTISIEEEAAQKLEGGKDFVKYKLDRLGIPLIEIATDASIKNNEHAKEVAAQIGMILRSVQGIKRGLGTIRQDVNVSINKGARTEIKGFQDLRSIPKVVDYEIHRQLKLIKQDKKLRERIL